MTQPTNPAGIPLSVGQDRKDRKDKNVYGGPCQSCGEHHVGKCDDEPTESPCCHCEYDDHEACEGCSECTPHDQPHEVKE